MEYTKDMILQVNYGQEVKSKKNIWKMFDRISTMMSRHKIMTTVISITLMLMILDVILVMSFVQVLNTMNF